MCSSDLGIFSLQAYLFASLDGLLQMIEKNKESQTQSLSELQQELKSLKALLLSRGPNNINNTPASPLPALGRPSIPAWQLASNGVETSTS